MFIPSNTLAGVYAYSFAIPYFSLLMVLLIFGIAYISTRRIHIALVFGLLASMTLTSFDATLLNTSVSTAFGILTAISIIATTFKNRKGNKNEG
ncbi:MAG: hypothetical protein ACP5LI_05930 [Hydrogenobaculum sp.]